MVLTHLKWYTLYLKVGYYQLLEDAEFQDANLVGDMATKLEW